MVIQFRRKIVAGDQSDLIFNVKVIVTMKVY